MNNMRLVIVLILIVVMFAISCGEKNLSSYAREWSDEVKMKIIEDAGKLHDSISIVSISDSAQIISFLRGDTMLRRVRFDPILKDTLASIYFSANSEFVLGIKYCDFRGYYEESISYKDIITIGVHKIFYCNGVLKLDGISFGHPVGEWKEYDSSGKLIRIVDHGNLDKLEELKRIKYYR